MASVVFNSPLKTVVIAIDIADGQALAELACQAVQQTVVSVVGFSAEIQLSASASEIPVYVIFQPTAPLAVLIRSLVDKLDELEQRQGINTNLLVHYGLVFTQKQNGKAVFVGSALRAARSYLRSGKHASMRAATRDFVRSDKSAGLSLALSDGAALVELNDSQPAGGSSVQYRSELLTSAQIRNITPLLAQHIGPLARALISDLSRRSPSLSSMIDSLAGEIRDPALRAQFEADVSAALGVEVADNSHPHGTDR